MSYHWTTFITWVAICAAASSLGPIYAGAQRRKGRRIGSFSTPKRDFAVYLGLLLIAAGLAVGGNTHPADLTRGLCLYLGLGLFLGSALLLLRERRRAARKL
jgi:hypothetical protein